MPSFVAWSLIPTATLTRALAAPYRVFPLRPATLSFSCYTAMSIDSGQNGRNETTDTIQLFRNRLTVTRRILWAITCRTQCGRGMATRRRLDHRLHLAARWRTHLG